ncbi:MAG TPA: hypothetical protein VIX89_10190 [Bryobacteraceae bacterium]
MSQLFRAVFGTIAVSLSLGAAQLAVGRDLIGTQNPAGTSEVVNSAVKADRADAAMRTGAATRTISLRLDALSDTSVLIRMPAAKPTDTQVRSGPSAPLLTKSGDRKATVACEPPVSVLTEVAKRLQPGRCIT